jgi:putative DNA primase/helicase
MNAVPAQITSGLSGHKTHITFYETRTSTAPLAAGPVAWSHLVDRLTTFRKQYKKDGPAFSPVRLRDGGRRKNADVVEVTAAVLDCDNGRPVKDVLAKLEGHALVAYSTFSNTKDRPKYRVIMPLDVPVSGADWTAFRLGLEDWIGEGSIDPATKDPARLYYMPSFHEGNETDKFAWSHNGTLLESRALIERGHHLSDGELQTAPTATCVIVAHVASRPAETSPEIERVRSALKALDARCGYLEWRNTIFGLKWTGWNCAEALARDWSQTAPDKFDEANFKKVWDSADPSGAFSIGTVFHYAKQAGWVDRSAQAATASGQKRGAPVYQTCNDSGNADRFIGAYGKDIRFVVEEKVWLFWHENRWRRDSRDNITSLAENVARHIYVEASNQENDADRRKLAAHANTSLMASRLAATIDLARSRPGISVAVNDLDADRWLLQVKNGVIDLRTEAFRPARREDLLTRRANVEYAQAADCPTWRAFIGSVTGGDEDIARFLQRAAGYALTGETKEQCFFFLHGRGANGKSTFVNTLRELLGSYAVQVQPDILMASKQSNGGAATPQLVHLKGARFIAACETEEGMRLSESLVKQLTGGDAITARQLYGTPFTFELEGKFFISGNYRPVIRGDDLGIWRRIVLIPFDTTFPPDKQDRNLAEKLRAEFPGILNWALDGVRSYRLHGLSRPARIAREVEAYRSAMDIVAQWLDDCCTVEATSKVRANDAYENYATWVKSIGQAPVSQVRLSEKLADRGFRKARDRKGNCYQGLRLRAPNDPLPIDAAPEEQGT